MITFKQYLREEDVEDLHHDSVSKAVAEYMKHCSQFPNVKNPLYRISGDSWMGPINHQLRTRSPRTRDTDSRGGTAAEQKFLFSQPSWTGYPPRRRSIFCSTNLEFDVGDIDDDEENLLMIFPFDGVKIAMLDDSDLNAMNILKGTTWNGNYTTIGDIIDLINKAFKVFQDLGEHADDFIERLALIKKTFVYGTPTSVAPAFDKYAKGNEDAAVAFEKLLPSEKKILMFVAKQIPEKLKPKDLGATLITSNQLKLPGKTRECWFSGKYLSVPAKDYPEFKAEVLKLQNRK